MRVIATFLFLTFAAVPAVAHGPVPVQPDALWRSWSFDPLVLLPLLLSQWLYGRGVLRLWARAGWGRGVTYLHVLSFALGETVLIIALVSPVDPLGETLLSAHMAQHALLVAVAPPLLLLGKPGVAFAWALPASRRRDFLLSTGWRRTLGAAFATLMHGGLLGALITMAPYPLYGAYLHHAEPWGLNPLEDQQLAGLLMWVPMGVIYLGACLLLAGRLIGLEAEPVGSSQVKTIPIEGGQL